MSPGGTAAVGRKLVPVLVLSLAIATSLAACEWLTNRAPVAVLYVSRTAGEAPLEVSFDASDSYDPNGDSIRCKWNFDDGSSGEGEAILHGYGSPGQYTVRVVVTDSHGRSDVASKTISVTEPSVETLIDRPFMADTGIDYDSGKGLQVSIAPSASGETLKLIVTENPTPQQPVDGSIELLAVYSISVEEESHQHEEPRSRVGISQVLPGVRISFRIPSGMDPDTAVILEWTTQGWVSAGSGDSLGGALSPDATYIYVDLSHLSEYALASSTKRFKVGDVVTVKNRPTGLIIRQWTSESGPVGNALRKVPNGWVLQIVDGLPRRASREGEDYIWWKVREIGLEPEPVEGWAAGGNAAWAAGKSKADEAKPWLEKVDGFRRIPAASPESLTEAQWREVAERAIEWASAEAERNSLSEDDGDDGHWAKMCSMFVARAYGQVTAGRDSTGIYDADDLAERLKDHGLLYSTADTNPNTAAGVFGNPPRGALIFFEPSSANQHHGHVGIYLGDGWMVNANTREYDGKDETEPIKRMPVMEYLREGSPILYKGWAYPPWTCSTRPAPSDPGVTGMGSTPKPTNTLTPTLRWEGMPGADSYGVYLREAVNGDWEKGELKINVDVTETHYTVPSGELDWNRDYRWNIRAHFPKDPYNHRQWSCYSERLYFRTVQGTSSDNAPPTTQEFSVHPNTVQVGDPLTVAFAVSDTGGSGLDWVELWRAADSSGAPSNWAKLQERSISGNSYSGTISDTPSSPGEYWYGIHVGDGVGNWNDETNSRTGGVPDSDGPIQVSVTQESKTLTAVTITGPSKVDEGETARYTCTAHFSDGTTSIVTSLAIWAQDCPNTTMSADGQLDVGTLSSDAPCTVNASYTHNDVTEADHKSVMLKNDPPVVIPTSLTISGPSQVGEGETEPYTCTAAFSNGTSRDVTTEASWSVSVSSSYATISQGQLTAKSLSSDKLCTITASYQDQGVTKSATKAITLKNDPPVVIPTSLTISGPSQVGEGETEPYTCTAAFSNGTSRDVTTEASWSVSVSSSYATISQGQLTAKSLSSDKLCTITASYQDQGVTKSATKAITLKNDPPVVIPTSLTISGPSQVGEGETEPYTCTAAFSNGTSRDVTTEASWSVSVSSSYATISQGQLTAKSLSSDKSCTITASYQDQGVTKSATKAITLKNDPPVVVGEITGTQVSPNPASVGNSVSFKVTVKNTGNTTHTFVAGLSVWRVGSPISSAIIDTNDPVTLGAGQQTTVTLRTHSFSSSQTGGWYYQFGLWKDYAGGTFIEGSPSPAGVLTITEPPSISGEITGTQVSPNPASVGNSVSFKVTVKNTGNTTHTFVAGLSVWRVGSPISSAIIDTNDPVTLGAGQQTTVTLRTHSFSSSQTGGWYYQFGLWKDYAGGTFIEGSPSPAGVLTITEPPSISGEITGTQVSPNPASVGNSVSFKVTVKNTGNTTHTFVAGLSVWRVGSPISSAIIDTNDPVTLGAGQQTTVTLRTHSFSSSQTGGWYYQFGLWKDYAGGTFIEGSPSPAGVLEIELFTPGDTVVVENTGSSGLLVRATSCGDAIAVKYDGSRGTIIAGPIYCNGYNRWRIRWDDGVEGWSAEDWLRAL